LVNRLRVAERLVTLPVTGPLRNLATALDATPEAEAKIERLAWMGGALNVRGNVREWESELIATGPSQGRTVVHAGGQRITPWTASMPDVSMNTF
jgi:inosine-uridine nucleoside N-ribohydrolase